jgi:hypothetical protein
MTDTYISLAVAAMCVLAVGVSATTLESSLSTDPDDVINLDWDRLPISQDDAAAIQSEMRGRQNEGDEQTSQTEPGSGEESQSAADESGRQGQSSSDSNQQQRQSQSQEEQRPDDPQTREPNIWDKLLALLRELLPWLVALTVLAAAGALAYRYRERLLALAALVLDRRPGDDRRGDEGSGWFGIDPATEIDRLWLQLVRFLDLEDPETTTVTETSQYAIERGLDPDGVRDLAAVFEEVRYGDRPASEERRRHAREGYRRLGLDERGPTDESDERRRTDGGNRRSNPEGDPRTDGGESDRRTDENKSDRPPGPSDGGDGR